MAMTLVEPGPSTLDPDNFAARADELFGTVLPRFATEATALEANVVALEESVTAAAIATVEGRDAALAAAAVASAGANFKGAWSGLIGPLAVPASVYHNNNYWMLLTGVADVTTKEPGVASEWAAMNTGSGGETSTTLSAGQSLVLTSTSKKVQTVSASSFGTFIVLPDATTLAEGDGLFVLSVPDNSCPVGLINGAGQVLGQIINGDTVRMILADNTGPAGVWGNDGNLDPWFQTGDVGVSGAWQSQSLYKLDETRSLLFYGDAAGYLFVRYVSHPADGSLSVGAEYAVDPAHSGAFQAEYSVVMGASNRLLAFNNAGYYILIDYSAGASLGIGSAVAHGLSAGPHKAAAFDSRYAAAFFYYVSGGALEAICYDCGASGTTITKGAKVSATGYGQAAGGVMIAHTVDANTIGVFGYHYAATYYNFYLRSVTRSGTGLTFNADAGGPTGYRTDNTSQNYSYAYSQGSNRYLFPYWANGGALRYSVLTFGTTCSYGAYAASGLSFSSVSSQLAAVGAGVYVVGGSQNNPAKLEVVSISGSTVAVAAAVTVDATSYNPSTCYAILASALDGRGMVISVNSANETVYRGFAVSGTLLTVGTDVFQTGGAGNDRPFAASYNFTLSQTDILTPQRFVSVTEGVSNYNSVTAYATMEIGAAGGITLGRFTKPLLGGYSAPMRLSSGRAGLLGSHGGLPCHGVFVGGKYHLGYGSFKAVSGAYNIENDASQLGYRENDSRWDRNLTLFRYRFAEV